MAESIKNQVDALTGFASTEDLALQDWCEAGVQELINVFTPQLMEKCSKVTNLYIGNTNTTMDMDSVGKILHVTRENADSGYYAPCRKIPAAYGDMSNDSNDMMYYATATDPVFWIESNSSGNSTLFVKPTPTANQPSKVVHIAHPQVNIASSEIGNFPDEANYLVVLYASCKALQRLMNNKSSNLPSDISEPVLSTLSTSLPSYTSPDSFVLPVLPVGANVDYSELGDIGVFVAPIFNGKEPTFTSPVMNSPDWSDTEKWITEEEDSEMLQARVAEIQVKITEFTANLQDAQAVFGKESAEYQSKLQQYATDIQNETSRITASLSEYQAEAQKALNTYQAETGYDISKYSAEIQANTQKFNSDLQDNSTDFMNNLQKYQAEIGSLTETNQSKLGKYAQDLANYGAKIQKHSMDYQWMQGQRESLMRDYNQGIQMLIGGGKVMPPQQKGER